MLQTATYLESIKVRKNFKGEGRKTFDLKEFRKAPIRIVYDALHGISTVGIRGLIVFVQNYILQEKKDLQFLNRSIISVP